MEDKNIKYLDVNKNIINAIFLLDGKEESDIRNQIEKLVEEKGETVKKKAKASKKSAKEEKIYDISKEVKVSPKRRVIKKLFKNKDYSK